MAREASWHTSSSIPLRGFRSQGAGSYLAGLGLHRWSGLGGASRSSVFLDNLLVVRGDEQHCLGNDSDARG
eukprot:4537032-Pleurochrysis_carterae.AAC.1